MKETFNEKNPVKRELRVSDNDNPLYFVSSIHQDIESILQEKYQGKSLYLFFKESLISLNNKKKDHQFLIQKYYLDHKILHGFECYLSKRNIIKFTKRNIIKFSSIMNFYYFIIKFRTILQIIDKKIEKKMLSRFESHLNNNFFAFQNEIETLHILLSLEFQLKRIPDLEDGKDRFDIEVVKNGINFEIECKTLAPYSGSPIILGAAEEFTKFIDEELIKSNISDFCMIEFSFEGKLVQGIRKENEHEAHTIGEKFNYDFRHRNESITLTMIDKHMMSDEQIINNYLDPQSILIKKITKPECFIKLKSKEKNTYLEDIEIQIKKSFTQFTGSNPAVIYLYLRELPHNFNEDQRFLKQFIEIIKNTCKTCLYPLLVIFRTDFNIDLNKNGTFEYRSESFQEYLGVFGKNKERIDLRDHQKPRDIEKNQ